MSRRLAQLFIWLSLLGYLALYLHRGHSRIMTALVERFF